MKMSRLLYADRSNQVRTEVANYSLSPYAISLGVRYARGGERRPISDVDGKGTSLRSKLLANLLPLKKDELTPNAEDDSRLLRISRLQEFNNFVFVEFGVARAGVEGNLHRSRGKSRVRIDVDDASETFVRSLFVFIPGAHEVYWLAERAGMTSAVSFVQQRLADMLRDSFPELAPHIDPVVEWSAVSQWADSVLVNELRFEAPRPGNSTQAMDVNGIHASITVVVKPHGSLTLSKILNKNGPNKKAVYGFLSKGIFKSSRVSAASVIEQGWKAKVSFKTPSGRQRSFGVSTEDKAPSLIYSIGPTGQGTQRMRPSDIHMLAACSEFLTDVDGTLAPKSAIATEVQNARPST